MSNAPKLTRLAERAFSPQGIVIAGCLSGTSADGIDVGLVRVRLDEAEPPARPFELLGSATIPYEPTLRRRVIAAIDGAAMTAREFALLDRDLGRAFAQAVKGTVAATGVHPHLVASHGQTVGHHDGNDDHGAWTLQLGLGEAIVAELGVAVVCDFRQADIAFGGEGAPLVPFVDRALYPGLQAPAVILNLGGVANLTSFEKDRTTGFDVGPANAWLDGFARRLLDRGYDEGGAVALSGRVDEALLERWLDHPFYAKSPPKSTGRDTFGEAWLNGILAGELRRSPADLCATASAAVATSVARSIAGFLRESPERLLVAGGGCHHRHLMDQLRQRTGLEPEPSDVAGVPVDLREALAFALLGLETVLGRPVRGQGVTGARSPVVLGRLLLGGRWRG